MALAGRQALVTGGGRGIGAACAHALTAAGATVTVLGRTRSPLAAMVASGGAAAFVVADVTDEASLSVAFDGAAFDILVNNAGHAESAKFARTDRALWDRMLALNLTAVYAASRLALPAMVARGWGRVVNIASTAGLTGYPYVAAYVAAKHGVVGLTRALALEYAPRGVTVNAVCPGYTETDMLQDSITRVADKTGRSADSVRAGFAGCNPQGRLVQPDEVAAAVVFLCDPAAGAMTGLALPVACGEVMR